jgi:hypothetical protein
MYSMVELSFINKQKFKLIIMFPLNLNIEFDIYDEIWMIVSYYIDMT